MKLYYSLLLTIFVVGLIIAVPQVKADSPLVVEWETSPGSYTPVYNILRETIANDTDRPDDRVYVLRRGGYYWITDMIQNIDFPLVIVGEGPEAVAEGEVDYGPAIIQRVNTESGDSPGATMFESTHNLTLRNLWIMGQTDQGNTANYEPIKLLGDGKTYIFDNVVFDRNDWHHLGPDGPNNDFYIINCKFRNLFGPTQIWEGLGVRFEVGADTVIIENNTFLNIGFTPFQSEAAPVNYLRFNHNTLVNIGRAFQAGSLWKSCYVTNNLFVNPYWHGDSEEQLNDPNREQLYAGFFGIGELPAAYGTNFDRKILLANNSFWRDPRFDEFDVNHVPPIQPQPFINDTTAGFFAKWDNMVMKNNYLDANPNLTTYPLDDAEYPGQIDSMLNHIDNLYADPAVLPPGNYYWDPGRDEDDFVNSIWPLPEDFSYTNSTLLTGSTDGLPLGDLNWFEDKLADFEANKQTYIDAIHNSVQAEELEIVATIEAERGTLTGDATEFVVEGFTYFQIDGSGYIQWDFDLETAGQYDLNIWTHLRGNSTRGQRVIVNDVSIHDPMGWGEYIWSPTEQTANIWYGKIPADDWCWTLIIQDEILEAGALTLPAGANTIRIEPSWGYQNFAGIDVIPAGTGVASVELRAPDAIFENVTAMAEGIDWTPSYFKAVTLNAGGGVEIPVTAPYDGEYMLRIFYAAAGSASGQADLDGTATVSSIAFEDTSDVFSDRFNMTAGSHTIKLSSPTGGVIIDQVQVIAFMPTGVDMPNVLPEGYALYKNYPNPFNPTTNIAYRVGKLSHVELTVYNVLGQKVASLVNARLQPGNYVAHWDASRMSSGLYFYAMRVGDNVQTYKMMLLK
jgi:hypothetical protein